MQKLILLFLLLLLTEACSPARIRSGHTETVAAIAHESPSPGPETKSDPLQSEYPGKTIDQVFPIVEWHDFQDFEYKDKTFNVSAVGYEVEISRYIPKFLKKDSRRVLKFQVPFDAYWSSLVGVSQLLGPKSQQIYVVATGPGAVCCTNYWIVEVTSGNPKIIFRSQDFGSFRQPMEVFDADGDGIYELVQFDSCMRYFGDDCGSCSPEPRAYFKYNKTAGKYFPAKRIAQDFVNDQFTNSKKWIEEKYKQWIETRDLSIQMDLRRSVVAHVADLLHVGEEQGAWKIFGKYRGIVDDGDRKEIERRLVDCKFYKALNSRK